MLDFLSFGVVSTSDTISSLLKITLVISVILVFQLPLEFSHFYLLMKKNSGTEVSERSIDRKALVAVLEICQSWKPVVEVFDYEKAVSPAWKVI